MMGANAGREASPSSPATNNRRHPTGGSAQGNRGTNSASSVPAPPPHRNHNRPSGTAARFHDRAGTRQQQATTGSNSGSGIRQEWQTQLEITVVLSNLPNCDTRDIFQSLSLYGRIESINIPRPTSPTARHAYIKYSPPPAEPFWNTHKVTINIRNKLSVVTAELSPHRRPAMIQSPARANVQYAEQTKLRIESLDFGVLSQEHVIDVMRTVGHPTFYPTVTFNLKRKSLDVRFSCLIEDPRKKDPKVHFSREAVGKREREEYLPDYKFEIMFRHLQKLYTVDMDEDRWALVISQKHPPKFWKRRPDLARSHKEKSKMWGGMESWMRTTDISYADWAKQYPLMAHEPLQFIDIGKWTTYRLNFHKSDTQAWDQVRSALIDWNVQIIFLTPDSLTWRPGKMPVLQEILDDPLTMDSSAHLALLHHTDKISLTFETRWQLEAAISQGVLVEQNITRIFLSELSRLDVPQNAESQEKKTPEGQSSRTEMDILRGSRRMHAPSINRAKNLLEYVTEADKPVFDPMSLFTNRLALTHHTPTALPAHCTWVRKLTVTPSKVYLSTPSPETTNRVLRHYSAENGRFLRVQFTDECAAGKIQPHPDSETNDSLFNKVYRVLRHGIRIGDRHFYFLAFGNSQFREHGAYFFSPTATISCSDIRDWMGDFSHINVAAKYAARLGQCFSTTRDPRGMGIGLAVKEIDDIESNGWCFSDGVGIISEWLATEITKKLKLYNNGRVPSAFQFRHGGSKGILVTWPRAKFNEICIRPSQKKFNARVKNLEIVRASRFSVGTLNRQTINILSCLGVPDQAFIDLTKHQLFDYSTAMKDPQMALKLLKQFVDENGMTITIAQMVSDGFMEAEEPFTQALLQLWRAWSMKLLREKARIVVEKGAFVLGCIDETGILRGHHNIHGENPNKDRSQLPQVFLQVPKPGQPDAYQVITGVCVVGRNPSLHPGDLRVVEAVDIPELRALRDVLVFPANGERDISSMCSGGDLDGDDYFIFWDPNLIPNEWDHPPMIHDALEPRTAKNDITINDVTKFFIEYMKNDSLSSIALAHVVWSDRSIAGPKSHECKELARLHSNAVDYVKTGQPARMRKALHVGRWPHFMDRAADRSYTSKRVLGKLYDLVAKVDFTPNFDGPFSSKILRRYRLSDDVLKVARTIKSEYDIAIRRIMNQREIGTEFEVWSTFVMSKPRVGSDYKVQEDMGVVITGLRDRFTQACIHHAGAEDPATQAIDREKLYPFIAAMYHVTWEEVQIMLQEWEATRTVAGMVVPKRTKDHIPFISFPWLFESDLGRIATSTTSENMELKALPQVPEIIQAKTLKEALSCAAASLNNSCLFHRGGQMLLTMLDTEDTAADEPAVVDLSNISTQSETQELTAEDLDEGGEVVEEEVEEEDPGEANSTFTALQKLALNADDE